MTPPSIRRVMHLVLYLPTLSYSLQSELLFVMHVQTEGIVTI